MKLYIAISPSRNDQWVGKTLFSCRRTAADGWYRESIASPWLAAISAMLGGWQFRTHDVRSQNAGPTGSMKSPLATRYPSWSMVMGSCASARAAGPNMGFAKCNASNCDWWHGQRMR